MRVQYKLKKEEKEEKEFVLKNKGCLTGSILKFV